jgi:subtilisin family serine protease
MATPHVTAVAALLLQKKPTMTQGDVEQILKSSALAIPPTGTRAIFDLDHAATITWDLDCAGEPCNPVGSGLIQVDAALAKIP